VYKRQLFFLFRKKVVHLRLYHGKLLIYVYSGNILQRYMHMCFPVFILSAFSTAYAKMDKNFSSESENSQPFCPMRIA